MQTEGSDDEKSPDVTLSYGSWKRKMQLQLNYKTKVPRIYVYGQKKKQRTNKICLALLGS